MDKQETPTPAQDTTALRVQFGALLRAARERAGYTIEELSYASKIMPKFIQALEEGNFDCLPGEVFCRGFVKSLARIFAVDASELVTQLEACYPGTHHNHTLIVQGSPGADRVRLGAERRDSSLREWATFLSTHLARVEKKHLAIGGVTLVLIAVFSVLIARLDKPHIRHSNTAASDNVKDDELTVDNDDKSVADAPVDEPEEQAQPEPVVAEEDAPSGEQPAEAKEATSAASKVDQPAGFDDIPVAEKESVATTAEPVNVAQPPAPEVRKQAPAIVANQNPGVVSTTPAANNRGEQLLEFIVKEPVNIRMNVDKKGWETIRYEPNTYVIRFSSEVGLLVFDAAAVDINYNGRSLGSLGSKGRVRRLSFVAQTGDMHKDQKSL